MYCLSEKQVDFILRDIRLRGITMESLQQSLLDHICILIEENLEADGDFETFYASVIQTFYKTELQEIEEATIFLLRHRRPFIVLGRNRFFLLLLLIVLGPFFAYDISWFIHSNQQSGLHIPIGIWGSTLVYSLFPVLVLLVLFFTPDRFDPLIPRKSKILIGIKPFIKILLPPDRHEQVLWQQ